MKINDQLIIKDYNNIDLLRTKSVDIPIPLTSEDTELAEAMLKYVKDSTVPEIAEAENLKPAVGISAIQIGINKKMFAVVLKDDQGNIAHEYLLVNPKIISESVQKSFLKYGEGCLSVEDAHEGYVPRHARIKIKAYNYVTKQEETISANGFLSIVFQHEMDHLNGVLFYDRINKNNPFLEPKDAICLE